jgi:hypothetical protein
MSVSSPPAGPVEWVALSFPGATLESGVAGPLAELVRAGTVRVLDAVVVHKAGDGTVTEGEIADETLDDGTVALDDGDGDVLELLSHNDLLSIAEGLENDTTTLVLVWENRWAAGFAQAVRTHGGTVLAHDRVAPADVAAALAATDTGAARTPEGITS